jgi:ectoine hydroxylase-related dioxygenase (phytanoyl-CoA dioxygenase family)
VGLIYNVIVLIVSRTRYVDPRKGGINYKTPWHRDLMFVPLDTNHFLTFWCPLRDIQRRDGFLEFATGSHRDLSRAYWFNDNEKDSDADDDDDESEMDDMIRQRFKVKEVDRTIFKAGDCTVHHGKNQKCSKR